MDARALNVRLFGELDLRLGDERLPPLDSARARSVLAYLLLNDNAPQSRQRLAFLLWPDSTEGQARTNLRHLLHTLRRMSPELDRFLHVTPQTLQWRPEAAYWLDVAAFEAALARADAASDDELAALRAAVSYYTGDLLDGCYDEWLIEKRERLRDRYIAALQRLTNLLADRGEHAEAIRRGRELLRTDPLNEDTYRLLMRVHDGADDRAGAVRVYHECVSRLQRELDVEPSAATMEAYARLMRSGHPSIEAEPERSRDAAAGLVGRDAEWDQLTDCWRDAEHGRAQLVLVTGEPGVGKSRIVEELATWCERRGALVGLARSYPTEGELGYGVVISWLRTADVASQLRAANPSHVTELSRLLPELDDGSETVAATTMDEADARHRLFDAVARTLTTSGRPTLLVADDVHWCDAQSLQLVHYLLRLEPSTPLLIVATVRREELDDDHPHGALVGELETLDGTTQIGLGRLTRAATEELALHLARGALDHINVDALYVETEGNPLFIVEAIRAGWDPSRSGLSTKLQAVISARLRRLSKEARNVLGMAATVGREFAVDRLPGASSIDDISFVRGLDELWRRGIIREQGIDAYDFSHGKIRVVAYEALSPAARRRNHLLIAEGLLKLHKQDPDAVSGEVARHYDGGGRVEDAVTWYLRAAARAQRLHAYIEAVQLLDRARVIVTALPEGIPRLKLELKILSALAIPLAVAEGFASARLAKTQRRAVELATTLGIDPEPPLLRSLAMSNLCRKDFDEASAVAGRLRRLADDVNDDVLLIESEYLSGIAAFWDGRFQTARRHLEGVVNGFTPEQRPEHLARFGHDPSIVCLSRLANTLWFLGHPNDARRVRRDALAMAKEVAQPFSRGVANVFAALLSVDLGETAQYREYVDALTADFEDLAWHWIASGAFHGYADVLEGRIDEGIARIRRMVDTRDSIDQAPGQHAMVMRLLVAAYDAADDADAGLRAADEALLLDGTRIWEAEIRRVRAKFLAAHGVPAGELDAELTGAADVARRQGAVSLERRIERSRFDLRART